MTNLYAARGPCGLVGKTLVSQEKGFWFESRARRFIKLLFLTTWNGFERHMEWIQKKVEDIHTTSKDTLLFLKISKDI